MLCCLVVAISWSGVAVASQPHGGEAIAFPRSLESYNDADLGGIGAILKNRIQQEPFNLVATLIFILAILHTFMASKFLAIAHKWEKAHEERINIGQVKPYEIHLGARLFHYFYLYRKELRRLEKNSRWCASRVKSRKNT